MKYLFLGLAMCFEVGQNLNKSNNQKLVKVVVYKFKSDGSFDHEQNLKNEIMKQKGIVRGFIDISFGETFSSIAKGFTYVEFAQFKDKKFLRVFNKSDNHQETKISYIKPILEEILVFDCEIKKGLSFSA